MRNLDQKAIKRIEGLFFNKKKPDPPDLSAFNSYVRGFDPWSGNYRTLMLEFADGSALLYPSEYSEFKDYVIVDQNNNKIPGDEQIAKYRDALDKDYSSQIPETDASEDQFHRWVDFWSNMMGIDPEEELFGNQPEEAIYSDNFLMMITFDDGAILYYDPEGFSVSGINADGSTGYDVGGILETRLKNFDLKNIPARMATQEEIDQFLKFWGLR